MKKSIELTIHPADVADKNKITALAAKNLQISPQEITALSVVRRSLDARPRQPVYKLSVDVYVGETPGEIFPSLHYLPLPDSAKKIHIAGFGPAGMFAALRLIELGIKPIIYERGKNVRERRRDIRSLMQEHLVNEDSNYCFGEGGAGTFSDGKLYTRSNKRGDIGKILRVLHHHGADPDILIDAHPHIGSNILPKIVQAIRETIIRCGGEIHFNAKLTDIRCIDNQLKTITINDQQEVPVKGLILAVGHSARDIFRLLKRKNIQIEAKPFAVGVRIEHPQQMINEVQYHTNSAVRLLPPAAYNIACQIEGKGVFSFCMCPGGIVVPASTSESEIVLNGMSVSRRNSPFANSGFVVTVDEKDWGTDWGNDPLAGVYYQAKIEQAAYRQTSSQRAPSQRASDFIANSESTSLPKSSYIPGLQSVNLNEVFPHGISDALRGGLQQAEKKMKGYASAEALLLAPETRTSSPVRMLRDRETRMHIQINGLFPSGEGAGYAGGIVSAAIDGELCAESVCKFISVK